VGGAPKEGPPETLTIKAKEFDHLVEKFGFQTPNSGDRLAWFEHEGKIVTRTRRSHGSGDVPMQHAIRQQLKLSDQQLRAAVDCSLSRDGYVGILRAKGLIEPEPPKTNPTQ
jgi:hypothetical protein